MRSIRRSLIGYFMLLLALAMGGMALLVNEFAIAAIEDREQAEAGRIEKAYELRRHEAKLKFDTDVMNETKALARELHPKLQALFGHAPGGPGGGRPPGGGGRPPIPDPVLQASEKIVKNGDPSRGSAEQFRLRLTMLELSSAPWSRVTTAYAAEGPVVRIPNPNTGRTDAYRTLSPVWSSFDGPRGLVRLQEAVRKMFAEDDEHLGLYQLNFTISPGGQPLPPSSRIHMVVRSPKLDADLPLNDVDRTADSEYHHDDVDTSIGRIHRVMKSVGARPSMFFWVPPVPLPPGLAPKNMAPRPWDQIRVIVSHARPHSELDSRLIEEQRNGEAELAKVRDDTRQELTSLRTRLIFIGAGSFIALILGGWFIVARGLAPVHKLSAAVSRVSEKDFHLTVEPEGMSHELLPIIGGLRQTLDSLRAAFEREKQAVGDISHELRTPIASMLATLDVALRKPRTAEQYRTTLEDCRGIAKQLGGLVERIMTLASLDAGAARDSKQFIDAANLVSDCSAVIRPLAEAHGLTFTLRTERPLELETDADKLREVLMNLLHNAVEYNRPCGSVSFTADSTDEHVTFEVKDTGIGMTPETRGRIFERFYRADASRHATGIHAGLGLAIVKEYVDRLGGSIEVESELNAGTTFRVSLPAAPVAAPEESDDFAESPRSESRPRLRPATAGS